MSDDLNNSAQPAATPAPPLEAKLTVDEAAKACGVSVRTMYRWLGDGKIKSCAGRGGRILLRDLPPDAQKRWDGPASIQPKRNLSNASAQFILPGLEEKPEVREAILKLQPS